jgi:hypothetical protein
MGKIAHWYMRRIIISLNLTDLMMSFKTTSPLNYHLRINYLGLSGALGALNIVQMIDGLEI